MEDDSISEALLSIREQICIVNNLKKQYPFYRSKIELFAIKLWNILKPISDIVDKSISTSDEKNSAQISLNKYRVEIAEIKKLFGDLIPHDWQ